MGRPGAYPTACLDGYRSSSAHTDDVRSVMDYLRKKHGITELYVLGHSLGTLSSRWLARDLGKELAGSIHSATLNMDPRFFSRAAYGHSVWAFSHTTITNPMLHVHNENDTCRITPYNIVKKLRRRKPGDSARRHSRGRPLRWRAPALEPGARGSGRKSHPGVDQNPQGGKTDW